MGELLRALRTIETLPTGSVTDEERERVGDCRRYLEHVIDGRLRG
ncbi:hypothetical protein AKJ09_04995 [Labilithrix luteola]|uniref:Uncharacterized protein n=1 Tax=Labilithrix luteola TaxID=1391654 RepID=A0A0K1PY80_9BACT|nr:hypothetical protein AKJ09_04995 [Labilithrix luteola]